MFKVLIINEVVDFTERLKGLIRWEEYNCELLGIVPNGIVGKAIAERQLPDIIFLSTTSSYWGGSGFINTLRQSGYGGQIVRLYSGTAPYPDDRIWENARLAICRSNITKDVFANVLLQAIGRLTSERNAEHNHIPSSFQKNEVLLKLVQQEHGYHEIRESISKFSLNLNGNLYVALLTRKKDGVFDGSSAETMQIINICKAILSQDEGGEVFITDEGEIGVILCKKPAADGYLDYFSIAAMASNFCGAVKTQLGIDVTCVLSEKLCKPQTLHEAFSDTYELKRYRYFRPDISLITRNSIRDRAVSITPDEIRSKLSELERRIRERNPSAVGEIITELYLILVKGSLSMEILEYARSGITEIYEREMTYLPYSMQKIQRLSLVDCLDIEQEYISVNTAFSLLLESLKQNDSQLNPILDKVTQYINENFCNEDISLGTAAERASVSCGYLSRIFKEAFGTTFVKYVTKMRVEYAKQLLRSSEGKIADVSRRIGYRDEKYFCRVFKSVVGITPTEYKDEGYGRI